jgi:hypothetical protein
MEGLTLIEQYLEVGVGLAEPTNARLSSCNDITIFCINKTLL